MLNSNVREGEIALSRMRSFYEIFPYPNRIIFFEPNPLHSLMAHAGFARLAFSDEKSANEIWSASHAVKSVWAAKLSEYDLKKKFELLQSLVPANSKILMVGCGTDEPVLFRRLHPGCDIVGVDLSGQALDRARQKLRILRVKSIIKAFFFGKHLAIRGHTTFIQGDASQLLKKGAMGLYDHIQCFGVLHHQPQPQLFFKALADSLTPNGTLRLMIYSQKGRRLERRVQRRYSDIWSRIGIITGAQEMKDLKKERLKLFFWQILNTFRRKGTTHYRFRYLGLNPNTVADAFLHPSDPGLSIEHVATWTKQENLEVVFCEGKIDSQSWIAGFNRPDAVLKQLAAADEQFGLSSNFIVILKKLPR